MTSSSPGAALCLNNVCFVIFLLVSCCLRTGSGSSGLQRFVVRPKSVRVLEGEDVTLNCVVEGQQGRVQWTKDGFALGFERHVPGYPRYTYLGDARLGQHHLVISRVSLTDDGEYQCQVGPTFTNPPIWAGANVTVLMPPSGISLAGHRDGSVVQLSAGSQLRLRCSVSDARPPPSLSWYIDSTQVDQGKVRTQVVASTEPPGRWSMSSQLVTRAQAEDDGKNVTCRVVHPGVQGTGVISSSVTLSVRHRPEQPVISGYKTGDTITAGEQVSLICRVTGGNPAPSLLWYREGRLLDDTFGREEAGSRVTVNGLAVVVQERDDGAKYECRATSSLQTRPLLADVIFTVHYGPGLVRVTGPSRVEEGSSVALRCQATEANPAASLSWFVNGEEVRSPGLVVSRVSTGGWLTSSQLVWSVEGEQEAGQVVVECHASHPALQHSRQHTLIITVVKAPGAPVLEGEVMGEVLSGSSVSVVCSSPGDPDTTTLRIYKGGQVVSSEVEAVGNLTRALARIRVTPADNGAQVKCEVTTQATSTPKVTSTRLAVLFGPRDVSGSAVPAVAEEGSVVTLACLTSSSNPPANITWTSHGTHLKAYNTHASPSAFSGSSTRSELQVRVTPEDNERTYFCQADNGLGSPLQRKLTLKVLHAPVWREIPAATVNVWEGSDLVITATAAANPGPVRYWWQRGRETLVGAGGELRLGRATRDMTGNYTVSAYSRRGAINNTFLVNVQYGPENLSSPERVAVSEGENVSIRCSATGNPVPHLIWTNRNRTVGSGVGVARLVLPSATPDDTGVYMCVASTDPSATHPATSTKLIVTQAVCVSEEEGGGTRGSWVSVGGEGRLVCRVKAHPPPSFTWSAQGRTIHNDYKFTINEPVLVDGLVSWMSVLEVADVTPSDYRTYLCSSTNTLGSDSTSITLRPPARPLPPTGLKVINVSNVTVTLGWVPNKAGGTPESYTVRYKAATTLDYQYEEVVNTTEVTVGGLQPGQEYTITSQATNHQGSSDYATPPIIFSTLGDGDEGGGGWSGGFEESKHLTSLLLLAIILAAVGLLALNIAIVICLLRRFRKKRSSIRSTASTKTTSVTTHGNTSSSSPDSHQHHHQHHHHLLNTLTPTPLKHHKELNRVSKSNNASASPSTNKHRGAGKDKSSMQGRAGKKTTRTFLPNGKGAQEGQVYTKPKNKNTTHFAQAFLPGNGNVSNGRSKKSPSSVSPEARSLIPHHQDGDLPTIVQMKPPDDPEDDQASDSSHESTETAIYLDNIPPAPDMRPLQLREDNSAGFGSAQHNLQDTEVQQYQESEDTQQTEQHEHLPATTDENDKQAHQARIMTELQNAIIQQIEQNHPHIHISGEPEVSPGGEQPMFPQGHSQPPYQTQHSKPANNIYNHLAHSPTSAASYNILTRAQQLSKLNHPGSTSPGRHMQWKQPLEYPIPPNQSAMSAEDNQQNVVTASPVRKRRYHQSSGSPHQGQGESPGRIPNIPVQTNLPMQQHLTPSDMPPRVRTPHSRHPSPIRTQLNSLPKSLNQAKYHPLNPSPDISHRQSPQPERKHILSSQAIASLNQLAQTPSTPTQYQRPSPQPKRISHPPQSPSQIRRHPSLSPKNSGQHQPLPSSHLLPVQHPQPRTQSPSWHNLPSTQASSNQPQSPPSPSQLHNPSTILHHLPPTPPGSTHRRPPPTPTRQIHQQPSPVSDRLPPPGPSTTDQSTSTRVIHYNQNPRLPLSRQQRNAQFRKSISRSLEDYRSIVRSQKEPYKEPKNSALTQDGKNVLVGSTAVSTSLPQDINWREGPHTGHDPYAIQMAPPRGYVDTLADDLTPVATSSPITSRRRRTRFPDDFLWQGSPGK